MPDEHLSDQQLAHSGTRPGSWRCRATDLWHGDCQEPRIIEGFYCYYHDKLKEGLTEPSADLYPVFPLPEYGYVITRAS